MTEEEAFLELDLPLGSTPESIEVFFRKKARRCHPDGGDPAQEAAYLRLLEARQVLRDRPPAQIGGADSSSAPAEADNSVSDAVAKARLDEEAAALVREVVIKNDLVILFDRSIVVGIEPHRGFGRAEERAWLARPDDWNLTRLSEAVMDEVRGSDHPFKAADIQRALNRVVREEQRARENAVMKPLLYDPLDPAERRWARTLWLKLVSTTLEIEPELGVAVLQHFMWQIKRKQLWLPVEHHLMPVITGKMQGSGKTTLLKLFLAPLAELASAPVLLSELADSRSGEILRFPVIVVDDVERVDPRHVPVLKSLLTADAVSRRRLGTSFAEKRQQRCTPIGTANEPIGTLIADPTGHRRFVELLFRNGAVDKGGDAVVWRTVNETDYVLLWRSVDGFGPSSILEHLSALAAMQAAAAPVDPLRECLISLDLRSEAVLNISVRGGVRADELRELLCAHMGVTISNTVFSARMSVLVGDPEVPLNPKVRISKGWVYPLKYPRGPVEMPTIPDGPSRRDPDRFRALSQTVAP
ncbi:J domain-containing protein [Methylobacterium sp. E-045]|uniref:J domain-containing protein n=1 Tax=Methylobacterium sp. E-045 TaxID=2836575 RepID=UPI001FB8E45E|nr:VapE domain-containing protein [Methylobacterium sp. E-045]MCJ2130890.1 hypothetical protein [Methylobacterium sp. E-045]